MDAIKPKTALGFNIIQFFECGWILNIKTLSPVQKVILKSIMSLPLDKKTPIPASHPFQKDYPIYKKPKGFKNELELYKFFTGKEEYKKQFWTDVDLCIGRRSGKSTLIGAGIALYFATQYDYKPYLGTNPHATIPIISPSKEQAGEVYGAIKQMILRSPYLFQKFMGGRVEGFEAEYDESDISGSAKFTGGQIKLSSAPVVIKVMAADQGRLRGLAVPFCILDEVCFFGTDTSKDKKVTDKGIAEAIEPAFSQFTEVDGMALLLKISSPNGQSGLMYESYQKRSGDTNLHWQVPSWWANPKVPVKYLKNQMKKGSQYFSREYGAQYTASESSYLDPERIDNTIIRGAEILEPAKGYKYVASMDYATKGDYWTFAIGHKEYVNDWEDPENKKKKEIVYADVLMHWKGSSGNELDPSEIIPIICAYMKKYGVSFCLTDQYAYAPLKVLFQREGCNLKEFKMTRQSKLKMMMSLSVAVNSEGFKMVHQPLAVQHLKDLREKVNNGMIKIEHAQNTHDDYADVIAEVIYQFDQNSPVYVGHYKEEEFEKEKTTKDARGQHLAYPTANELAEHVGVSNKFSDNRAEWEAQQQEKEEPDEDDNGDDGLWYVF